MTRTAFANPTALLAITLAFAGAPAALAQSPSGGASPTPSGSTGPAGPTAAAAPTVVVAGGAVTLRVQAFTLLGHPLAFSGQAPRGDARRSVLIERYDARRATWVPAATTVASSNGSFATQWRTSLAGLIPFKAVVLYARSASRRSRGAGSGDSSEAARATIYRPAVATFFGPGFYGSKTACGQTMSRTLVGVANRTLRCGTLVQVSYGGRLLTVPVVDRGPYANGADWDLTSAAADALGITETVHIGTLVAGRVPSTPSLGSSPSDGSGSTSSASGGSSSPGTTGGAAAA